VGERAGAVPVWIGMGVGTGQGGEIRRIGYEARRLRL
jgi:hypothetical protein